MSGTIHPFPNTPSGCGAQLKAQGQLHFTLNVVKDKTWEGAYDHTFLFNTVSPFP
jgi:hypothetical protein